MPDASTCLTALDLILAEPPASLCGARIGLIANQSARDASGRPAVKALLETGLRVERLFAPEHGHDLSHQEGARFGAGRHPEHGIPIVPFYGDTMKLGPDAAAGLDILVFDLPNVGLRCHTYLANLAEALEFSHQVGFPLMVLDRPNVLGGAVVEGPCSQPRPPSDVAPLRVPFRHGMTWLELARWTTRARRLAPALQEVPMQGWRRSMWQDDTGLAWHPPSPNLPTFDSAVAYTATVFLEGSNLSEGRGTDRPFQTFGAPWLEPARLLGELETLGLPGVEFRETTFTPSRSKHQGQRCLGVSMDVRDRVTFRPLATGFALLDRTRALWPEQFSWLQNERTGFRFIDRLLGTELVRRAVDRGAGLAEALSRFESDARAFEEDRRPYLLYEA
ncbi:MAG: DUF1343 domain-containing protein [Candidatus Wallbacteria bacterium]|nr:DUF1343 domain-containing protein [Candidatus Wallbacteria bacterium]